MPAPPSTEKREQQRSPKASQADGNGDTFPGGVTGTRAALGTGAVLLLLHAANALAVGSPRLGSAVFAALGAGIVAVVAARAALVETEREVWAPATVALMAWLTGSLYYTASSDRVSLYASSAFALRDAVLLCFGAAAALAAARLARARVEQFQPTIVLDGAIAGLAGSALGSALIGVALAHGETHADPGLLSLAFPAAAVVLLIFAGWLVALSDWRPDRLWSLLLVGFGLLAVASIAFVFAVARGAHAPGGPLETVWLAGAAALAIAAWQPRGVKLRVRREPLKRIKVTSFAALAALALLLLDQFEDVTAIAVVLATAAVTAVIARAAVSFRENVEVFASARLEAQTDPLTGLGNRRKLMDDLRRELELASVASPRVLVMFDLDGFKRYNDTYGHPAGDALLTRLGANLGRVIGPYGNAYRLGGDEFCVLVVTGASSAKTIIALAATALSEHGEGFTVRSSHGAVMLPHEARDATLALKIADQRMYAQKEDRRSSATRQTRDILLQVLHEREPELGEHLKGVAKLAVGVASRLDLGVEELDEVVRAAELHDIGKMAIPDEILHKPGPLTEEEWSFVRQHTIIGERILSAAPALLPVAKLVRASHEHFDGSGYPDGLAGDAIPLGARIVGVCDAFHAMTSMRPYRPAIPVEDALAELRACAGTQFDPAVVEAFSDEIASIGPRYGVRPVAPPGVARPAA